jgi:hypothetical protein
MDSVEKEEEINIRRGTVTLSLNSYDSLFSDFDQRDYSERILSEDFIEECKRAVRGNESEIELILSCPRHKRNLKDEAKIRHRIKEYFMYIFKKEHEMRKRLRLEGLFWFLMGSIVMILATLIAGKTNFFMRFLEIMTIPAGWFLFWEGLDKVLITSKERLSHYEFYKKMSRANILFAGY